MEAHIQRAAENEGQKSTTLTEQVGTKVPSTKCVLTKISWNFLGANFEKGTFLGSSLIHCVKEIRGHVAGFRNNNYGWMSAKWRFFTRKLCNNSQILPHSSWLLLGCFFHFLLNLSLSDFLLLFHDKSKRTQHAKTATITSLQCLYCQKAFVTFLM